MAWPEGESEIPMDSPSSSGLVTGNKLIGAMACPSCGHHIALQPQEGTVYDLPGLPAGVKFDPTDGEILEHLEAKVKSDSQRIHPLIDEFIRTLEGENGICSTHPEKLPGVSKDGLIRHFFHRPSKAYTTGTRKRRKVHTDQNDGSGSETRWHKTGKTRAVVVNGAVKGFKKILVLYTNYGRQRKPEKTNWVTHQYHLGGDEEEKEGELVVSKVFYQTQQRQCGQPIIFSEPQEMLHRQQVMRSSTARVMEFYNQQPLVSYQEHQPMIPGLGVVQGDGSSLVQERFEADRRADNM